MKRILCFDFDGTLADSIPLEKQSMVRTLNDFGHDEITLENIAEFYGPTESGIIAKITKEEAVAAIPYYYQTYYDLQSSLLKKEDKIKDLLLSLKDRCHLVLLTGRSRETLEISLEYLALNGIFEKIYSGSEDGVNKGENVELVKEEYGVEAEDILYIGDTLEDVRTMREHDVEIISAGYYHSADYQKLLEDVNPGNVVYSLDELKTRLEDI